MALAVGHAIDVVGADDAAAADAELEAAPADVIDGRDLFGDAQGVVQRKDLNRRPDAQALGPGGDGAGDEERGGDHRANGIEVDLPQPDAVDAPGLGRVRQLERLLEGLALTRPAAHLLDEDPEVHRRLSRSRSPHPSPARAWGTPDVGQCSAI